MRLLVLSRPLLPVELLCLLLVRSVKLLLEDLRYQRKELNNLLGIGHGGEAATPGNQDRSAESSRKSSHRSSVSGNGDSSESFKAEFYILFICTSHCILLICILIINFSMTVCIC